MTKNCGDCLEIEHKFNTRGYSCIVFTIAQVGGLGELVFFFFPQNSQGKQIFTFLRKQTKKSQPFFLAKKSAGKTNFGAQTISPWCV